MRYISFTNFECKSTAILANTQVFGYVVQHKSTICPKKVRTYPLIFSNITYSVCPKKVRIKY